MTLIVSTRVPDGIVIAADSLSTITAMGPKAVAEGKTTCPSCGKEHKFQSPLQLPMGIGMSNTLPYSQKLIPLWHKYAVGTHGSGAIGNRSIFAVIRNFERENGEESIKKIAKNLGKYLQDELKKAIGVGRFDKIQDKKYFMGLQIVGYEEEKPLSITVDVGKENLIQEWPEFGTTVSGNIVVSTKLWELKGLGPQFGQPYPAWSVQDAADYCEYLIETTAQYQRFASVIPTVGGEIDIGLILPGNKFRWIREKKLARILLEEE